MRREKQGAWFSRAVSRGMNTIIIVPQSYQLQFVGINSSFRFFHTMNGTFVF